jgi:RNA polymerase sigma factor (sigma-70 family)
MRGVGGVQFEEVFQDLFADAYHVAYRIVGGAAEAEDIAAETLARALSHWRRVGAMSSPAGWVMRVATNLAIDIVRRRRFVSDVAVERCPRTADFDIRLTLRDLLASLPRRQRDVLALRYLADFSEAEIATVLGISTGTVKRHASRGLTHLRWRVREPEGEVSVA